MKKLLLALVVSTLVFGCSSDDEEAKTENSTNPNDYSLTMTCRRNEPGLVLKSNSGGSFTASTCRIARATTPGTAIYSWTNTDARSASEFDIASPGINLSTGTTYIAICTLYNGTQVQSNSCSL